jgi:hypothetical protein
MKLHNEPFRDVKPRRLTGEHQDSCGKHYPVSKALQTKVNLPRHISGPRDCKTMNSLRGGSWDFPIQVLGAGIMVCFIS